MSAKIRFEQSDIPKRFISARLSDFESTLGQKFSSFDDLTVLDVVKDFIGNAEFWTSRTYAGTEYWYDDCWRCLFINGPVGVGKSHLLAAIAAEYSKKAYVKYTTAYDMSQTIMQERNADKYKGCSLLIIDEMGRTFETKAEEDRFFDLINHRYDNLSPVIFCGNLSKKKLRDSVGEAVADRMAENMSFITLVGKSRRIESEK